MRILGFWIKSLLVIIVVGAISGLLAREALLIWGVAKVRTSVSTLGNISRNSNQYARQCQQKGGVVEGKLIDNIQLRFTSDTEFVLEVVCGGFKLDPIEVRREVLPMFVKKRPGSGGIIWGTAASGVVLDVFGRSRAVIVEESEIFYESAKDINLGVSPRTSCEGFGYECCPAESSQGVGTVQQQVTDCPRTCYSSCKPIPVVLSFTSDPFMDPQTRTTKISSGQTVTFSYVADSIPGTESSVLINYGDGSSETFDNVAGLATHAYTCSSSNCRFSASIQVQTTSGLTSRALPVSEILILVN